MALGELLTLADQALLGTGRQKIRSLLLDVHAPSFPLMIDGCVCIMGPRSNPLWFQWPRTCSSWVLPWKGFCEIS